MDNLLKENLEKYFARRASLSEIQEVEAWLANDENKVEVHALMEQDLMSDVNIDPAQKIKAFEILNRKINVLKSLHELPHKNLVVEKGWYLNNWLKVAASLLLPIIGYVLYIMLGTTKVSPQTIVFTTLSQEKKTYTMADGTKVILNGASELKIMPDFNKNKREIYLEGEAYLEVTKNASKPFLVYTSEIRVKVLGTKFNVESRKDKKDIKVYLDEGKVSLTSLADSSQKLIMKPAEYAKFLKNTNQFSVSTDAAALPLVWKEKKLYIKNEGFREMVQKLEAWYHVSFHLPANIDANCKYMLMVEKESLPQLLQMVNLISPMTYTVQGEDIYIKDINCNLPK